VEYAGLMNNEDYKEKIQTKIALCDKYKINLIILENDNIGELETIFSDYLN